MYDIKLLYDTWCFGKPIPNCIRQEIFNYIKLNENLVNIEPHILSFNIENKFGNKHNIWMSNIGIKSELEKTDDIDENWIYPIEPWGHIMYSLNLDAEEDYYNFFELIPKKIIENVNNNKGKIVINYAHEGWVSDFLLKGMYIGIKNAGIKFDKIVIILNDFDLENKINKFKKNYSISNFPFTINYCYYLTASSNHFYNKNLNINLFEENKKIKFNKFLFLNRRLDLHRVKLMCEIYEHIKYDSIISFDKNLITDDVRNFLIEYNLTEKFDLLPNKIIADREDIQNTNGYQHENEKLFLESYISIVTETSFYNNNDFISEKIWKPIFYFHPFIVVGRPHLLKYLKEIGFKTFDWLINEEYDNIEDNDKRMEYIEFEIIKLSKLSNIEIHKKILQNYDSLIHNYNLLNSLGKDTQLIQQRLIDTVKKENYNYSDIYKELNINYNEKNY